MSAATPVQHAVAQGSFAAVGKLLTTLFGLRAAEHRHRATSFETEQALELLDTQEPMTLVAIDQDGACKVVRHARPIRTRPLLKICLRAAIASPGHHMGARLALPTQENGQAAACPLACPATMRRQPVAAGVGAAGEPHLKPTKPSASGVGDIQFAILQRLRQPRETRAANPPVAWHRRQTSRLSQGRQSRVGLGRVQGSQRAVTARS